jgi:DNA repair photolyase
MTTIYEPKGKAREYSPFALNLYLGCMHNCKYCYCCHTIQKTETEYYQSLYPRKNIIAELEKELSKKRYDKQVLLSFVGDIYSENADGNECARQALEVLHRHDVPVAILTKGGKRCLKDLDIFKKFGSRIQIGATLTFFDEYKSHEWESGAASPAERLETLKTLHDNGIRTFASFEPVIEPTESIKLIEETLRTNCVDVYKIGKLNNYKGLDKVIDWTSFLKVVLNLLRKSSKQIYVKFDLRNAAAGICLTDIESNADYHCVV